jgi:hypothetical protein
MALSPRLGLPCNASPPVKVGWWDVGVCLGDGSGVGGGSTMEWRLRRYRELLAGAKEGGGDHPKLVIIDEICTGTSYNAGYAVGRSGENEQP